MPSTASVIARAEVNGRKEGKKELGKAILDYLENEYLSDKVERGTEYSKEILDLAKHLAHLIHGEIK